MPLTVNVGLSRKSSRDFQSAGSSINLTAELDQALLHKPAELHAAVGRLYEQAAEMLDRRGVPPTAVHANGEADALPRRNGRGRPATTSQRRLLSGLASDLGLDLEQLAGERCAATPRELTIRDASRLIDHLRTIERAG